MNTGDSSCTSCGMKEVGSRGLWVAFVWCAKIDHGWKRSGFVSEVLSRVYSSFSLSV